MPAHNAPYCADETRLFGDASIGARDAGGLGERPRIEAARAGERQRLFDQADGDRALVVFHGSLAHVDLWFLR